MSRLKSEVLAKQLTEKIENGTIRRKISSISKDKYDNQVEELCLYCYRRYLGSLRCMLDTQNMRKAINNGRKKDKLPIKKLVKTKN